MVIGWSATAAYHGSLATYSRHTTIYSDGGVQDIGILTQNLNWGGRPKFWCGYQRRRRSRCIGGYGMSPPCLLFQWGTMPGPWHARWGHRHAKGHQQHWSGGREHGTAVAGVSHPFLWQRGGGMVDLNSLIPSGSGWSLGEATAMD